jgi:3-oxoacyl-[acyl-carrier-protein] synthase II
MTKRRVVVTGLGMLSPLGVGVERSWDNILAGKSGIRPITEFDASAFAVQFAGTVPDYDPLAFFSAKDIKKMDISIQYGVAAAIEAMQDSGLEINDNNAARVGVAIGSGIGGLTTIQETTASYLEAGPRKISPFFIPSAIINMISGHVAIMYGAKGPNIAIVTACTTGTHNIGYAARTIQYGDADVMIAGGAEKASCELGVGGFAAARALSKRNDNPQAASRPWDKDRDGFVLGDGAGVVVLEEYEHAKARGATIYAELAGFGMSADAYHITLPDGVGAEHAMRHAMTDAHVNADLVDYVNAHGTSTPAGDAVESQAIERALGDAAQTVSVSSTKSMVGHALGAAGALEAIYTVLAIRDQVAPPTINLENIDEGCHLDYVPNQAKAREINVAMSNSFGFGGTNGTLLFKKA